MTFTRVLGVGAALALLMAVPAFSEGNPLKIQAEIPRSGGFMGFGFGSLWMMSGSKLVRINAATNSVRETLIKGFVGHSRGVGVGEGAVWLPDVGSKTVFKIDPATEQVTLSFPAEISDHEGSIGVGFGSVWITTNDGPNAPRKDEGRKLARFDAQTGELQATIDLPAGSKGVAIGEQSIWVTGTSGSELYCIDPATNALSATIELHKRPRFLAADSGSVWILNQSDGTVQRVDQKTRRVTATVDVKAAGPHGDITVGGGFVWVTMADYPVYKIDPASNTLAKRFERPQGTTMGNAIRYGAGSLWLSGGSIYRIEPP